VQNLQLTNDMMNNNFHAYVRTVLCSTSHIAPCHRLVQFALLVGPPPDAQNVTFLHFATFGHTAPVPIARRRRALAALHLEKYVLSQVI
jgi:hypothetical protein